MKRKKAAETAVNTEGWMMSYADMATILLAMFIVLSTLAKDQTGVNLYNGTGSFRRALDCFGMPGLFGGSSKAFQSNAPNPQYLVEDTDGLDPDKAGKDPRRVIDAEEEKLQHFLQEMNRQFKIEKLPRIAGQAVVDFHDRLNSEPPYLKASQREIVWQVLPHVMKKKYRVVLVVWAATPAASAWNRAARQARAVADDIARESNLPPDARARLIPVGQPWRYPNYKRPIMSLVISKLEEMEK